ncbi:hypothetical protein RhiirA5_439291 [Rhizophagus irregularis]|uniref:Uncharacterized protein n=1 Tax=Rhizophagus irregularis TaxID=588596 RepID=A0A2N0NI42_9GLOM|nr:hypothetical protein RhiirA5_439291 [Rhizophagus irregularis]
MDCPKCTIHKVFPDRFSHQGQTKKEKILICSLKQKSDELEKFCNNEENIVCGIKLEEKGKIINPKFTQTFMVMHEKDKLALYNANHNIKQLKTKVAVFQNERSNLDNKTDLINQKSEKIKKSQYLSLVLSHPCNHCYNTDLQNKFYHVSYVGFNIIIDIDCQICSTIDLYSNQSKGINFSHLVAASALASGINRYTIQTALAVMGITTQSCKQAYHKYQSQIFPTIISKAEESARQALDAAIVHTNTEPRISNIKPSFSSTIKKKFIKIGTLDAEIKALNRLVQCGFFPVQIGTETE